MAVIHKCLAGLLIAVLMLGSIPAAAADNTDLQSFFSLFDLDRPELSAVKAAVQAADYEKAVDALLEHFQTRTYPVWYNKPTPNVGNNPNYNTTEADKALRHEFTSGSVTACPDDPPGSGDINWTYTPNGDKEWYWLLNRHSMLKNLAYAYYETGQEKYAEGFEEIFSDWYEDNPAPMDQVDTDKTWRTLEAGLRLDPMIYYFNTFLYAESVSTEVKLNILRSLHDHGAYLTKYCGTNNWLLMECKGLYGLAIYFPEFKDSKTWETTALTRMQTAYDEQFLPDGWQHELTTNYHIESAMSLYSAMEVAQMNGIVPALSSDLLKSYEVAENLLLPGNKLAALNDTTWARGTEFLYQGFSLAEDAAPEQAGAYLAAASEYHNGDAAGLELSSIDEYAGLIHFRDYRGKNEMYGMLEVGNAGHGSHGGNSKDKLQFILSANDRELLIDPGVYNYTSEPLAQYMYQTQAHNTVTIDNYGQIRREQEPEKVENADFFTSEGMDYGSGLYHETFDETKHIPVTHQREVVYVKSGYFVINDTFAGSGSHTARQYWNFAPGPYVIDEETGWVHTAFADGSNVLVIPVEYTPNSMESACGSTNPYLGWTNVEVNHAVPTLNIAYKREFSGTGSMQTVILPYQGTEPPQVSVTKVDGAIEITMDGYTDRILFGSGSYGQLSFTGKAAVVRSNASGVAAMNKYPADSSLKQNGQELSAPSIPTRKQPQIETTVSNSGAVQAEWAGIAKSGTYRFVADNNGAVALGTGGILSLHTDTGLQGLTVRARAADTPAKLAVYENGTFVREFTISADGTAYSDYRLTGLTGGEITVVQISGQPIIDSFTLDGDGEPISQYVLRNRTASPNAVTNFGLDSHTDYTVSADMQVLSPLTASDTPAAGVILRNHYQLRYDFKQRELSICRDDTVLSSIPAELEYGQWYTFAFGASGDTLTGTVRQKDGSSVVASISASDSSYSSGKAALFCSYADTAADHVTLTLGDGSRYMTEEFERYRVGARASNWSNNEAGRWGIEGIDSIREEPLDLGAVYCLERFDDYTGGLPDGSGWRGTEDKLTAASEGGNTYLKMSDDSEIYYYLAQAATGTVMIEADCMFSALANVPMLIIKDTDGTESFNFRFTNDGKIKSETTGEIFAEYSPNQKYHVRMVVNLDRQVYDLYLNGKLIGRSQKLAGSQGKQLQNIKIVWFAKVWGPGNVSVDNLQIASVWQQRWFEVQNGGQPVLRDTVRFGEGNVYLAVYQDDRLVSCTILEQENTVILVDVASPAVVKVFNWKQMQPLSVGKEYVI